MLCQHIVPIEHKNLARGFYDPKKVMIECSQIIQIWQHGIYAGGVFSMLLKAMADLKSPKYLFDSAMCHAELKIITRINFYKYNNSIHIQLNEVFKSSQMSPCLRSARLRTTCLHNCAVNFFSHHCDQSIFNLLVLSFVCSEKLHRNSRKSQNWPFSCF